MAGHRPTLDAEWSLLRAVCSPHPQELPEWERLSVSSIRWSALFQLADHHGVLPLLCQGLSSREGLVPPEEMRSLKQSYQANLHKALLLSREFIRIADCLDSIGVEFLPYKGLALAEGVYSDIALRQAGDIDLLIRPRDLARTREAVRELGYVPHTILSSAEEVAYLKSGYECAFDSDAGRNLLEVQWAIQPRFYAVDYDIAGLFDRAMPLLVAGRRVKTPCFEDLFIVLALHASKHAWARLVWLCDLVRITECPSLNWAAIGLQAKQLGIARILHVNLLLARSLLGLQIPEAANVALPHDSRAEEVAEKIVRQIATQAEPDVESLDYFRLMLQLRERHADRICFLGRLAFTPGPGEWATVRLPRALFPLYRLVRVSRLAARVVSG